MAATSKVIRLSQKLTGVEPSISTLNIGFVGHRFQKKSIAEYIIRLNPPFWKPF